MPSLNDWSDGSMWMRVLEAGEYQIQKVTVFNMLDIRGDREWYRTKKNKPVHPRGAAIHVLNRMQYLQTGSEQPGSGLGA